MYGPTKQGHIKLILSQEVTLGLYLSFSSSYINCAFLPSTWIASIFYFLKKRIYHYNNLCVVTQKTIAMIAKAKDKVPDHAKYLKQKTRYMYLSKI